MNPLTVIRFLLVGTVFTGVPVGHHVRADELPPVFDGKSLDNWTLQDGKPVPSGWEVLDGTIHRKPNKKRTGHIVTRHEYGDFELSFEWKIAKGGNSGLKYRVRKYGRKMLGFEYQIHDLENPDDVPENKHTGALYDLFEPDPKRQINPCGEFNASRIVVRGDRIEHWLNGWLIMSAIVGSPEWEKRVALSKFGDVPDFGRNRLGRIMLTDHGAEVWYRNFKITAPTAAEQPSDSDLKLRPGKNLLKINFKGVVRERFIDLPTDMQKGERYPVVFGFHGDGGPKEAYNRRLSPYVNKYQIIGISIQGTPKRVGSGASSWDHHDGSDVNADDIGFVQYLVDYLDKTERVDLKRVYATGGSSGGLFCYRLANETKLFAAIGPTKCGMIKGSHEPDSNTANLSIMQVIGNEDKSFHGSSKRLTMYSAEQRIEIWRSFLKCNPKPSINTKIKGMTVKTYVNDTGDEIVYCMLHGVGHSIPKPIIPVMDGMIVDFFMRQKKP